MAKNVKPEGTATEQKIETRYDRRMAARKEKERKDKRDDKIFKITTSLILAILILAIVVGVGSKIVKKQSALHGTYITLGDRKVSELEFDYYYNISINNYLQTYGSLISYMGLDTSSDFDAQIYDEENGLTWADFFEEMGVQQMKQTFALSADGKANGFEYDTSAEYDEQYEALKSAAEAAGSSVNDYCKTALGQYATASNVKPFIEESLYATAYYNQLLEDHAATAEEIKATYEADKQSYDKVDYHSFVFTATIEEGATDEEKQAAMDEQKALAEEFLAARKAGEEFEELCIQYAPEETKANYEAEDSELSLLEGRRYSSLSTVIRDWLFEDSRAEGDQTILEDTDGNRYYVLEFGKKYYDADSIDQEISSAKASEAVTAYISDLIESFQESDPKGKLDYLKVAAQDSLEDSTENTDTSSEN